MNIVHWLNRSWLSRYGKDRHHPAIHRHAARVPECPGMNVRITDSSRISRISRSQLRERRCVLTELARGRKDVLAC